MVTRIAALGGAVRNRWRQSFVASITLVALLGVVAFAFVIGRIVKAQIEDQAFDRAKDTAQITARAAFAPRLPAPGQRLSGADLAELDRQLASARQREPLLDMRLWSSDGSVIYSRERLEIATLHALALPGLIRAGRALRSQYDPRRVEVVRELRQALARDDLTVHFQPIVESAGRKVHSAEALVRWEHPRRGPIPPDRFIPVVEPTEVMWPFTLRVLELAIHECKRWRDAGQEVDVAVNVSGEILPDRRLPGELERLLRESGLPAQALEIEVTEGAVMRDPAAATRVLRRMTDLGVSVIAIDDFGTGYSSLARLHELPLDTLKIDQSFVRRMATEDDETVVRSIVELAHALGLTVIAEGVEDDATWARLAEIGSDFIQGYAITRPLPPDDFADWLAREESQAGILDP